MSFIFIHLYYFQIHSTKHDELFDDVAEIMLGNILYLFLIWRLYIASTSGQRGQHAIKSLKWFRKSRKVNHGRLKQKEWVLKIKRLTRKICEGWVILKISNLPAKFKLCWSFYSVWDVLKLRTCLNGLSIQSFQRKHTLWVNQSWRFQRERIAKWSCTAQNIQG